MGVKKYHVTICILWICLTGQRLSEGQATDEQNDSSNTENLPLTAKWEFVGLYETEIYPKRHKFTLTSDTTKPTQLKCVFKTWATTIGEVKVDAGEVKEFHHFHYTFEEPGRFSLQCRGMEEDFETTLHYIIVNNFKKSITMETNSPVYQSEEMKILVSFDSTMDPYPESCDIKVTLAEEGVASIYNKRITKDNLNKVVEILEKSDNSSDRPTGEVFFRIILSYMFTGFKFVYESYVVKFDVLDKLEAFTVSLTLPSKEPNTFKYSKPSGSMGSIDIPSFTDVVLEANSDSTVILWHIKLLKESSVVKEGLMKDSKFDLNFSDIGDFMIEITANNTIDALIGKLIVAVPPAFQALDVVSDSPVTNDVVKLLIVLTSSFDCEEFVDTSFSLEVIGIYATITKTKTTLNGNSNCRPITKETLEQFIVSWISKHNKTMEIEIVESLSRASPLKSAYFLETSQQLDKRGFFDITTTVGQGVTKVVGKTKVCRASIQNCKPPSAYISTGLDQRGSKRITKKSSDEIKISASLNIFPCRGSGNKPSDIFENFWTIETRPVESNAEVLSEFTIRDNLEYFLPSNSLSVGSYTLTFTARQKQFCGEEALTLTDEVEIEIKSADINAIIEGNPRKETMVIKDSQTIEVSGTCDESVADESMEFYWFCYKEIEKAEFAAFIKMGYEKADGFVKGCFGDGFATEQSWKQSTTRTSQLIIPVSKFTGIPGDFTFHLVVESMLGNTGYAEQIISLKKVPEGLGAVISSILAPGDKSPYIVTNCVENCLEVVDHYQDITLNTTCINCKPYSDIMNKIFFDWVLLDLSGTQKDTKFPHRNVLTIPKRLFAKYGEYEVSSTMYIKYHTQSIEFLKTNYKFTSMKSIDIPQCSITPEIGMEADTKFTIECIKTKDTFMYSLFEVVDLAINEQKLLYEKTSPTVEGLVLTVGNPAHSYKKILRILIEGQGRKAENYISVYVKPLDKPIHPVVEGLLTTDFSSIDMAITQGDMDRLGQLVNSLMGVLKQRNGSALTFSATGILLQKLQEVGLPTKGSALKMSVIESDIVKSLSEASRNKDLSLYFKETHNIIKSLKIVSRNVLKKFDGEKIQKNLGENLLSVTFGISEVLASFSSTDSEDMKRAKQQLFQDSNSILHLLGTSDSSQNLKTGTAVITYQRPNAKDSLKLSLINGPKINFPSNSLKKDTTVALAKYGFDPHKYESEHKQNGFKTSVVGISILPLNNTPSYRSADYMLQGQNLDVYMPTQYQSAISKWITLPPACAVVTDDGSPIIADTDNGCGHVMVSLTMHTADVSNTVVAVRPKRACRIANAHCIEINFISSAYTENAPNGDYICADKACEQKYERLYKIKLPMFDVDGDSDPWSFSLPRKVVDYVTQNGLNMKMLVYHMQYKALKPGELSIHAFKKVSILFMKSSCFIWNIDANTWDKRVCDNGRLAQGGYLRCVCSNTGSEEAKSTFGSFEQNLPMFLIGDIFVLPNEIEFDDVVDLMNKFRNKYYVVIFLGIWWAIFALLLVWAKRRDSRDSTMREIIIPIDNDVQDEYLYEIVIFTAAIRGSGTTANVTIFLEDDFGKTKPHVISDVSNKNSLQAGGKDSFLIAFDRRLRNVKKFHAWHDNSGENPSWRIHRVAVFDLQDTSKEPVCFVCERWLSLDHPPYQCGISQARSEDSELLSFGMLWKINLSNSVRNENVWTSLFTRPRCSTFTLTQRWACLATAMFGCMMSSIIFYESSVSDFLSFQIGYVHVDISVIIKSLEAAIVLAPVNVLIVFMFRKLRPRVQEDTPESSEDVKTKWKNVTNSFNIAKVKEERKKIELEAAMNNPPPLVNNPLIISSDIFLSSESVNNEDSKRTPRPTRMNWFKRRAARNKFRRAPMQLEKIQKNKETPSPSSGLTLTEDSLEDSSYANILENSANSFAFPYWFHYVVWALVWVHVIACTLVTCLYGMHYSSAKFLGWLVAFILSVTQNILFVLPFRVVLLAVIQAALMPQQIHQQNWIGFAGPWARIDALRRWKKMKSVYAKHLNSHPNLAKFLKKGNAGQWKLNFFKIKSDIGSYRKPSLATLTQAGRRSTAVAQIKSYWIDVLFWILLTVFVTLLIWLQRDWRSPRVSNRINQYFSDSFSEIQSREDILPFISDTVVPIVYHHSPESRYEHFKLLGPLRLRQTRVRRNIPCPCIHKFRNKTESVCFCKPSDASIKSDHPYVTDDYGLFWKPISSSFSSRFVGNSPWIYRPLSSEESTHFLPGTSFRRSHLPSGGYIQDIGYSLKQAYSQIEGLRQAKWIDNGTATLIIEFSLLNPILGHVSCVTLTAEFLATGGVNLIKQIQSYKPIYIYSTVDVTVTVFQILHIMITCKLAFDLFQQCKNVQWKLYPVYLTLTEIWNILVVLIIFWTIVSYVYYGLFLYYGSLSTVSFKMDPLRFTSFSVPAYYNVMYFNFISLVAFLSYIRVLKTIRGSESVSLMVDTLVSALNDISNVTVIITIILVTFAVTGYVSFGQHKWNFYTYLASVTSLVSLSAGMDIEHPAAGVSSNWMWGFYFAFYMIFVLAMFLNLYAAVLYDAFHNMRMHYRRRDFHPVETMAISWMREKINHYFGVNDNSFSRQKLILRKPPHERNENKRRESLIVSGI